MMTNKAGGDDETQHLLLCPTGGSGKCEEQPSCPGARPTALPSIFKGQWCQVEDGGRRIDTKVWAGGYDTMWSLDAELFNSLMCCHMGT